MFREYYWLFPTKGNNPTPTTTPHPPPKNASVLFSIILYMAYDSGQSLWWFQVIMASAGLCGYVQFYTSYYDERLPLYVSVNHLSVVPVSTERLTPCSRQCLAAITYS